MLAIFKKEFRAFFNNVLGWLFVAVNFAFLSLYFFAYNLFQGSADVGYVYSYVVFLFLIIIPVLTMKIISQDRREKTDQLIFTAPISLFKVIMGKYLALVAVFSIPAAMSALYPVILSCFGTVSMPQAYTALLGYWLYGIALIAVGMFISSMTENTIVAAVLSVLVFFLLYIMAFFETISSSIPGISKIITQLDMNKRLTDLTTGMLDFGAILYFLSICAIFIFLTISFIRRRRWTFSKNKILKGLGHTTSIIVVIALIVAANWGFSYLPEKYKSIDVNSQKIYELTDQTCDLVNKIDKDILIEIYSTEAQASDDIKKTLRHYKELGNISIEYINPKDQPNFANKYGESSLAQGSLVVSCGDKYKVIDESSIYKYDEMSYYYTGQSTTTGYDAEGQITSAIAYVTSDKNPIIYNVTGNSEATLGANFTSAISKENIDLKTLDLMKVDQIPEDADALMILAPATDINEGELQILRDYVEKGGNIYMTFRYTEKPLDNLNSLVADYHLEVKRGVIMESDRNDYYKEADYLIPQILSNSKAGSSSGDTILMVQSVGFTEIKDSVATATDADAASSDVVVFAQTSDNAVLKTNITKATTTAFEEGDEKGSFILGAYSQKGDSKFVIFGTPLVTDDNVDNAVSGYNVKLFGNMISNLVDHETTVSIPVKSIEPQYVTVPSSYMIIIGVLFIFVIPLILIVLGIFIWVRRKKK
ncbi:MAG: Gldg family protein [Eubacterium sp.]|nr:Gldg family protein [Eubacterium sp.]